MNIKSIVCATCTCLAVVSFYADAALVSRLGGLAYYDTVADLTWLADANAGAGSTFDDGVSPDDGSMTPDNAINWAASLDIAGVTGWRLPTTLQPDASCSVQAANGSISTGFNCTGSEMGNLFYNVLGGIAQTSITDVHNDNFDLFSNIVPAHYVSSTLTYFDPDTRFAFKFGLGDEGGMQVVWSADSPHLVWAVHSGDVSAVPVPAAVWLFGSGLLGLFGVAKRKERA